MDGGILARPALEIGEPLVPRPAQGLYRWFNGRNYNIKVTPLVYFRHPPIAAGLLVILGREGVFVDKPEERLIQWNYLAERRSQRNPHVVKLCIDCIVYGENKFIRMWQHVTPITPGRPLATAGDRDVGRAMRGQRSSAIGGVGVKGQRSSAVGDEPVQKRLRIA